MDKPAEPDYYFLLNVDPTATTAYIKAQARRLHLIHHPDKGGDPQRFREIREAEEFLRDSEQRTHYDRRYEELKEAWHRFRVYKEEQRIIEEISARLRHEEERRRRERETWIRSEEVAAKARKEQECAAQVRLQHERAQAEDERRRQKQREAEEIKARLDARNDLAEARTAAAAERRRLQIEQEARERLATERINDRLHVQRQSWAALRQQREQMSGAGSVRSTILEHPATAHCKNSLGWTRLKGVRICQSCQRKSHKYNYLCNDCVTVACRACQSQHT